VVAKTGNNLLRPLVPIVVAAMSLVIGSAFIRETKDHKVRLSTV